jgi:hypothetical protein
VATFIREQCAAYQIRCCEVRTTSLHKSKDAEHESAAYRVGYAQFHSVLVFAVASGPESRCGSPAYHGKPHCDIGGNGKDARPQHGSDAPQHRHRCSHERQTQRQGPGETGRRAVRAPKVGKHEPSGTRSILPAAQ